MLRARQRPRGFVGLHEGRGQRFQQRAGVGVAAPVVQAHGQIEQEAVGAGEVEVEEAAQPVGAGGVVEHHVVAEQVGVDRPARERQAGGRGGHGDRPVRAMIAVA